VSSILIDLLESSEENSAKTSSNKSSIK